MTPTPAKAAPQPRPPSRSPAAPRPPSRVGAKAKAAPAQAEAAAPAPAPAPPPARAGGAGGGRHKRLSKAYTKDVEDVVDKLFDLSDDDSSGLIDFGEFLVHHRAIMGVADFAGPQETNAKVEMRFREYDKDNSLSLDREEFRLYMDSVLSILGKRRFVEICGALHEEALERAAEAKKGFDPATSGRLVDKARGANYILPDIEQVILQMIEKRADINFTDGTGSTVLLYAVDKCENSFLSQLLSNRADPSVHNKEFDCPAFRAARARSVENLKLLLLPDLKPCVEEVAKQVKASQQLVRDIANMSGADVAAALKKGADLNFRDSNGWTPLTAAVFWGKPDCMEALLRTQTTHAQVKLRLDLYNGRGRAAIHIAARKGRTELITPLLKARCSVDLQDSEGWTALHHAIFNSMEESINLLLDSGASLVVQGKAGLTPVMLSKMPECVGKLTEKLQKRLDVPEALSFAKAIVPALKDEGSSVFSRLEAILDLPGVYRSASNLRLYEQFFDCRHGPNKVRLQKLWEALAMPLMRRLATQSTDMEPAEESEAAVQAAEMNQRMREQVNFLKQWFVDTRGPRRCVNWKYDNREAYREELTKVIAEELASFREQFQRCYEAMQSLPGGADLVNRPALSTTEGGLTTQLQAHQLLPWLQRLDAAQAFEALRAVGAEGMGGDDVLAVMSFVDLIATNGDFDTGKGFWKNVYKLWLQAYARLAHADFQKRMEGLISRFAEANCSENTTITFASCEPKSYERIREKEKRCGESTHETYPGRTVAGQVLDVVRCSVTVNTPLLVCRLLDEVFAPLKLSRDKLEVMKVVNLFAKTADTEELMGNRRIELTVLFDAGVKPSVCGRKDLNIHVKILGEVQIVLEDFLNLSRRGHVLFKASRGYFDWPDEEDDGKITAKDEDVWR